MKPEAVVAPSQMGVPFGCRSPHLRGPYSMLNHSQVSSASKPRARCSLMARLVSIIGSLGSITGTFERSIWKIAPLPERPFPKSNFTPASYCFDVSGTAGSEPGSTERSCWDRAGTRDSGDAGGRRAFFQLNGDRPDDDLGTAGFLDRRFRNWWIDDYRCEFYRIFRRRQNKLSLPRHRPSGGQLVRLQAMSLGKLIHHHSGPKAFRYDLPLDLIRPMSVALTSRLPGCEKLQCSLHVETPVAYPWISRSQIRAARTTWGRNTGYVLARTHNATSHKAMPAITRF